MANHRNHGSPHVMHSHDEFSALFEAEKGRKPTDDEHRAHERDQMHKRGINTFIATRGREPTPTEAAQFELILDFGLR